MAQHAPMNTEHLQYGRWDAHRVLYEAASEQQSAALQQQYHHALEQWHQAYHLWRAAVQLHTVDKPQALASPSDQLIDSQAASHNTSGSSPVAEVQAQEVGMVAAAAGHGHEQGHKECGLEHEMRPSAATAARAAVMAAASSHAAAVAWSASSWAVASAFSTGAIVACPSWQNIKHLNGLHPLHLQAGRSMACSSNATSMHGSKWRGITTHDEGCTHVGIKPEAAGCCDIQEPPMVHKHSMCVPQPRHQVRRWQVQPYRTSMVDQRHLTAALVYPDQGPAVCPGQKDAVTCRQS